MALSPEAAVIIAAAISAVTGALAGRFSSTRKARLDRLNQSAAAADTFAYSRKLQEWSHFISKKHEVVAELHTRLVQAKSRVLSVVEGRRLIPRLEDANREDVRIYMTEHQVLGGIQDQILAAWDQERDIAIKKLHAHLVEWEKEEAQRALVRAKNYFLHHELYVSHGTGAAIKKLLKMIEEEMWRFKPPIGLAPSLIPEPAPPQIYSQHDYVSALLREELNSSGPTSTSEESRPPVRPLPGSGARGQLGLTRQGARLIGLRISVPAECHGAGQRGAELYPVYDVLLVVRFNLHRLRLT